jgi:hypothetical protein
VTPDPLALLEHRREHLVERLQVLGELCHRLDQQTVEFVLRLHPRRLDLVVFDRIAVGIEVVAELVVQLGELVDQVPQVQLLDVGLVLAAKPTEQLVDAAVLFRVGLMGDRRDARRKQPVDELLGEFLHLVVTLEGREDLGAILQAADRPVDFPIQLLGLRTGQRIFVFVVLPVVAVLDGPLGQFNDTLRTLDQRRCSQIFELLQHLLRHVSHRRVVGIVGQQPVADTFEFVFLQHFILPITQVNPNRMRPQSFGHPYQPRPTRYRRRPPT